MSEALEPFADKLREIAQVNRANGQMEFRVAAMRWLTDLHYPMLADRLAALDIDTYLTPEEIANREKMP
jgi:hypothetical protein